MRIWPAVTLSCLAASQQVAVEKLPGQKLRDDANTTQILNDLYRETTLLNDQLSTLLGRLNSLSPTSRAYTTTTPAPETPLQARRAALAQARGERPHSSREAVPLQKPHFPVEDSSLDFVATSSRPEDSQTDVELDQFGLDFAFDEMQSAGVHSDESTTTRESLRGLSQTEILPDEKAMRKGADEEATEDETELILGNLLVEEFRDLLREIGRSDLLSTLPDNLSADALGGFLRAVEQGTTQGTQPLRRVLWSRLLTRLLAPLAEERGKGSLGSADAESSEVLHDKAHQAAMYLADVHDLGKDDHVFVVDDHDHRADWRHHHDHDDSIDHHHSYVDFKHHISSGDAKSELDSVHIHHHYHNDGPAKDSACTTGQSYTGLLRRVLRPLQVEGGGARAPTAQNSPGANGIFPLLTQPNEPWFVTPIRRAVSRARSMGAVLVRESGMEAESERDVLGQRAMTLTPLQLLEILELPALLNPILDLPLVKAITQVGELFSEVIQDPNQINSLPDILSEIIGLQ